MESNAFKGQGRKLGSSSETSETTSNSHSYADLRTSIEGPIQKPTRPLSRLVTQSSSVSLVESREHGSQETLITSLPSTADTLLASDASANKKRKRRASTASTASLPDSGQTPSVPGTASLSAQKNLEGEEIIELLTDEDRQRWMEWMEHESSEVDPLQSLEIWYHSVRLQTLAALPSTSTTKAGLENGLNSPSKTKSDAHSIDTASIAPKSGSPLNPTPGGFRYPAVLKTWCFGYPRERDIKLEEIVQKNHLSGAVLTSFGWDLDFWWSKINRDTTPCQFIMQRDHVEPGTRLQDGANRVILHPENTKILHSKFMLLFFEELKELRLVITSANMFAFDWGEMGGFEENIVFVIDLPETKNQDLTQFGIDFSQYCLSLGLSANIVNQLKKYNWEMTRDLIFVGSQGQANAKELPYTGLVGLSQKLARAGLTHDGEIEIDYVASSIGKLNWEFLSYLYEACKGKGSLPTPARCKSQCTPQELTNNIRVYFASQHTVDGSKGGRENASTLSFYPINYYSLGEEMAVFRDCKSHRPGCLMHSKILLVQPKGFNSSDATANQHAQARRWSENPHWRSTMTQSAAEGKTAGSSVADSEKLNIARQSTSTPWIYVGSANCSWAAWSNPRNHKKQENGYNTGSNWECGVIIPVRHPQVGQDMDRLSVFNSMIPVPMRADTEPLHPKNRRPFFQSPHDANNFQPPQGLI